MLDYAKEDRHGEISDIYYMLSMYIVYVSVSYDMQYNTNIKCRKKHSSLMILICF